MTLYVLGYGGHAKVARDILELNKQDVKAFYDDSKDNKDCVAGEIKSVPRDGYYFCAIGDNKTRESIVDRLGINNENYLTIIHPKAIVARDAKIGYGCMIGAGSVIQPNVTIGNHVIINTNAVVEHDCVIEDYAHIAPNATLCGSVIVGKRALIGAGSTVIPKITIEQDALVRAGSVAVTDVKCKK